MKTTIQAISSVQGSPQVLNLECQMRVLPGQYQVRTVELLFGSGRVVPVAMRMYNQKYYIELWSFTNALRRAGVLHSTDTLVSGGELISLVTGHQPFVAREGQEYDEILHEDYEEQD